MAACRRTLQPEIKLAIQVGARVGGLESRTCAPFFPFSFSRAAAAACERGSPFASSCPACRSRQVLPLACRVHRQGALRHTAACGISTSLKLQCLSPSCCVSSLPLLPAEPRISRKIRKGRPFPSLPYLHTRTVHTNSPPAWSGAAKGCPGCVEKCSGGEEVGDPRRSSCAPSTQPCVRGALTRILPLLMRQPVDDSMQWHAL